MSSLSIISMATISSVVVVCTAVRNPPNAQRAPATTSTSSSNLRNVNSLHSVGNLLKCATQSGQRLQRRSLVVRASASGGRELFQATGGRDLYQPFRPPPGAVQQSVGAKSVEDMLQILRDKEGLWYQYAAVLPLLTRCGYSPSEIDEATGINGHEQNKLVVGSQVRASLVSSGFDQDALAWFDNGGAEILYELRTLSAQQRRAAAEYVRERNLDGKGARDLAKSVKDYERRKTVKGWESFSPCPGDSLALSYLRQSKDARRPSEMELLINQALEYVETELARKELEKALNNEEPSSVEEKIGKAAVTIMRLSSDDIPVVLPVCDFSLQSVSDCPSSSVFEGNGSPFPIYKSPTSWQTFVSISGWKPIVEAVAPIAISLPDSKVIPEVTGIKNYIEPTLLIIDKGDRNIVPNSYYLADGEGGLSLKTGEEISEGSFTVVGKVLIALRPPLPQDPNNDDDHWE